MKLSLKTCSKSSLIILSAILYLVFVSFQINAQNALILNGAYIIENGGTATNNIHIVIDQPDTLGIVRLSTGGHIHSESQYNFVTWNTGTNTGSYIFPFGVGGNITDSIPFTFNKTAGNSTVSISTWATDQQNNPKPEQTNVSAVTNMNGITDSVLYAIDRFWDIQAPSTTADLTFSYRGIENTTTSPTDLIQAQHWNGNSWDTPVGPGTNGITSGIGTAGIFAEQSSFSPWVLITTPNTYTVTINPSICQGDSFVVGINSYTVSGTYVDTLTNSFGCDSIITTNLTVNPLPYLELGNNQYICESDAPFVADAGTGMNTYEWNTSNQTQNISVTETGIYSVTVSNQYNCFNSDSLFVQVDTMPHAEIFHNHHYCINDDAFYLEATLQGGTWEGMGIADNSTGLFVPQDVGDNITQIVYTLTNGECTSVTETDINVHALPNIQVVNLRDVLCFGDITGEIEVAAPGSISPQFVWVNHGISGADIKNLPAGVYDLEVTDAYSCKSDTSLFISQPSKLNLYYEIGNPSCIGYNNGYVEFEVTGGVFPYMYSCEIGESDSSYFLNLFEGEYNFEIRDDNNCTENVTIILNDNPDECLSIPNAFTPNDDGINDFWIIENIDLFEYYDLKVFNRWGQEMYSGMQGSNPWNGRYMNKGKKVPTGSYVYVIKIDDGKNNQSGIVTVVY